VTPSSGTLLVRTDEWQETETTSFTTLVDLQPQPSRSSFVQFLRQSAVASTFLSPSQEDPRPETASTEAELESNPETRKPSWFNYVTRRLAQLVSPAEPIPRSPIPSLEVVVRALGEAFSYFTTDTPPPSVGSIAGDGVEFAWHRAGWNVEVDVTADNTWVWVQERASGEAWTGPLQAHLPQWYSLLSQLTDSESNLRPVGKSRWISQTRICS